MCVLYVCVYVYLYVFIHRKFYAVCTKQKLGSEHFQSLKYK